MKNRKIVSSAEKENKNIKKIIFLILIIVLFLITAGYIIYSQRNKVNDSNIEESSTKKGTIESKIESANSIYDEGFMMAVAKYVPNSNIIGDVNCDTFITEYDAWLIGIYLSDSPNYGDGGAPTTQGLKNADVNGDNQVTYEDYHCIKNYLNRLRKQRKHY